MVKPIEIVQFVARSGKRIAISVIGGAFVLLGLAMLVLPGPGIVVVVIGFAILGTEYAWAARALDKTKEKAAQAGQVAKNTAGKAGQAATDGAKSVTRRLRRS
ncbi:MAG: PGPGW domain-containing protein [Acidimicrobiales bacterium]